MQTTLEDSNNNVVPFKTDSNKYKKITRAIVTYIVKDLRPLSTVQGEGFQEMITTIEPRYQNFPSNRTVVNDHILPMYHTIKDKVSIYSVR